MSAVKRITKNIFFVYTNLSFTPRDYSSQYFKKSIFNFLFRERKNDTIIPKDKTDILYT